MNEASAYSIRASKLWRTFQAIAADPAYSVEARRKASEGLSHLEGVLNRVGLAAQDLADQPQVIGHFYRKLTQPLLDGQLAYLDSQLEHIQSMGVWYNPFSWGYTDQEWRDKKVADAAAAATAAASTAQAKAYNPSILDTAKATAKNMSFAMMIAAVGISAWLILKKR